MIKEERSILWEEIVSVIVEKSSNDDVSNSEWLPSLELFETPDLTPLDFCLWG
jgi:hypothetical protein